MAKKNTSTKTIIVISASVLIAGGLGFLIWKLVKDNKKKKEEEKRKKEEGEALKKITDMLPPISVEDKKKSMVKGAVKEMYKVANQIKKDEVSNTIKEVKSNPILMKPIKVM